MTKEEINAKGAEALDSVDGLKTTKKSSEEDVFLAIEELELEEENSSDSQARRTGYGFAGRKTVVQGLMDIALMTANANQLRYALEFNRESDTYHLTISLIAISLVLQFAVAMFLIFKSRYYVKGESKSSKVKHIKNCLLFGTFLISVVNVFIASFTRIN